LFASRAGSGASVNSTVTPLAAMRGAPSMNPATSTSGFDVEPSSRTMYPTSLARRPRNATHSGVTSGAKPPLSTMKCASACDPSCPRVIPVNSVAPETPV